MIRIEVDQESLRYVQNRLGVMRNKAPQVISSALNDTARSARMKLSSGAKSRYIVKSGASKGNMTIKRATYSRLQAVSLQAFFAQSEVIRELADEGPCVIVGRCSDYVLGERPNCLKVFIHADLADRVTRCAEEYHIEAANMTERVKEIDRGRANYYNYYTGHNWGEMRQYDLTLNSSVTGVDGAVELIATLVRLWEKRDQESR